MPVARQGFKTLPPLTPVRNRHSNAPNSGVSSRRINDIRAPLFHVDAFTSRPFHGNPAAVCLLRSWLDDASLLKVAAENCTPATAFLVPSANTYEIRWFTAICELKLCGHATLASAYVVLNLLQSDRHEVEFLTRFSGTISVRKKEDSLVMDLPARLPLPCPEALPQLEKALGAMPRRLMECNQTYLAVFDSEREVRGLSPDMGLLAKLHPNTVTATARGTEADFVSRYFAPSYGTPEDPVTGSAHAALAPYWGQELNKDFLYARQLSERGGELWCALAGDRVMLKGQAVVTLEGEFCVEF